MLSKEKDYFKLIDDLVVIVNYAISQRKTLKELSNYFCIPRSKLCAYIHHMLKYEEPELYNSFLRHLLEVEIQ